MEHRYVIGIDAGGTKVAYGLFDGDRLVRRIQHASNQNADGPAFADTIIAQINALLAQCGISINALSGIGLCMPSFILYEKGHILMTSSIPGIKDFPMRDYLEKRLGARVVMDNDSNAAALAEHRFGAGRGVKHMIYIVAGTGLGGGIIINGKLFHGTYGWAGECGHMIATPQSGIMCGCENPGCYMSYTSGRFIPAHVARRLSEGVKSMLTADMADGHSVIEAYRKGDALALELIEQMARYLGICIFNMYQMLNINTFVFGGGLVNFGEALFSRVRETFDSYNHIALPVHFKMAELEKDFGIIGAAEFIREDNENE